MATPYQRRRIAKLKKDIEEIERHCFYFLLGVYPDDADAERYALESKKNALVRSAVIENHLGIEEMLTDLIRIEVVKRNRRSSRKRVTPGRAQKYFDSTFREAQAFVSGGTSIGFVRKATLLRMSKLISKKTFDTLLILNALRNRCGHVWILREGKGKRWARHTLTYKGQNLFDAETLAEFVSDYNDVFLKLVHTAGVRL